LRQAVNTSGKLVSDLRIHQSLLLRSSNNTLRKAYISGQPWWVTICRLTVHVQSGLDCWSSSDSK